MKLVNDSDKRIPLGATDAAGQPLKKPVAVTVNITRKGLGKIQVKPGETVDVPDHYCRPQRGTGGARLPSAIECIAPHLRPADPDELAEWERVPPLKSAARKLLGQSGEIPTTEELIAKGMSPGAARAKVAQLLAEKSYNEQEANGE